MGWILVLVFGPIIFVSFPEIVLPIAIFFILLKVVPDHFARPADGADQSLRTGDPETRRVDPLKARKAPEWMWGERRKAYEEGRKYEPTYSDDPKLRAIQEEIEKNTAIAQEEMRKDIEKKKAAKARAEELGLNL